MVDHTARQGLGLAKHVHTRHFWLQAARDEGRLDVVKIRTERNPGDLLTKPLPFNRIQELCKLVGVEHDQDSMTREAQCPTTRSSRTCARRAKWLALRSQVCQAAEAIQHKVAVVSRRVALLLSSHLVCAVPCVQRAFSAGIAHVRRVAQVIGAVVNVQFAWAQVFSK